MQSRYDRDDDDDRFRNNRGDAREPRHEDQDRQQSSEYSGRERYRAGEYRDWRDDFAAPRRNFGDDPRRFQEHYPASNERQRRGQRDPATDGHWGQGGGYGSSPSYQYSGRTWPGEQSGWRNEYRSHGAESRQYSNRNDQNSWQSGDGAYGRENGGSSASWPRSAYGSPTSDSWRQGSDGHWQAGTRDWGTSAWSNRENSNFGKGPKGYMRSDDRIREDVCDRLSDDDEVDASEITVTVKSGEVTLEGTVTDRYSKRRAEDIVESVSGVQDVSNRLRTRKSFMQELGNKLTGSEESEHRGHAGSGTRNGPSTSSASRSS